jgi:phenylpyruvate tautomerase PptA (4-oxalocrotonate tautomerase family)
MIDAFIPEGVLSEAAEAQLMKEVTDLLIRSEGFDPANELVQSVSVVWVHHTGGLYVGGQRSKAAWYRFVASVPEGQFDDEARGYVTRKITEAVARAEGSLPEDAAARVWVFPIEVPDGWWGARGNIVRLGDILARLGGEPHAEGKKKLAKRRQGEAVAILEAASQTWTNEQIALL